jgi:drug/metabolite transporter (DMT)-like permease
LLLEEDGLVVSSTYKKGMFLSLGGVLIFSPDALLIRLSDVDTLTLLFSRGTLGGTIMLLGYVLVSRTGFLGPLKSLGKWGLVVVFLQSLNALLFYSAFAYTSAANILIAFACIPLFSALLARVFLNEAISAQTGWVIAGAGLGLIVVASGGLGKINMIGDALALLNALFLAVNLTILRGHQEVNMIPAVSVGMAVGGLFAGLYIWLFAQFPPITSLQLTWLVVGGAVMLPLALTMLTQAPRYLPVPEVAMITLLEAILGPFWVWWVVNENPGLNSLVGGSIVILVLFIHSYWKLRLERQASR